MKEKLKELLSIPTKTWEEERLINYLISHFEEMGYNYEKDDLGNLYVTKGVSDYYPLVLAHTDSVHDIEEMIVNEEYLPNSQGVWNDSNGPANIPIFCFSPSFTTPLTSSLCCSIL